MKKLSKEKTEKKLTIKLFLCIIYLIVITILFVSSYQLFQAKYNAKPWGEVESVDEYSYIKVSRMSEKFAYYEEENIGIHFVIEKEETGIWHTYLIAINENDYDEYKAIIDYTYERTTEEPKPKKVYGYPEIIKDDLKTLAIKNIVNFIPKENEITITADNFETYITNSYLDTTKEKQDYFSYILFVTLILLFVMVALFVFTIFDRKKSPKKKKKLQKEAPEDNN